MTYMEEDYMSKTIGEEIEDWKRRYQSNDTVGRYIMGTVLLLQEFKVEQEMKWLKTQPEISRKEYEEALKGGK